MEIIDLPRTNNYSGIITEIDNKILIESDYSHMILKLGDQ